MNKNEIDVSILICCYNVEKYINRCLSSIVKNTYINKCEILIIDDCSKDNTQKIIQDFLTINKTLNMTFIKNKKNMGISYNRQELLNKALGKYIIFVDGDDFVEKNYIEKLLNHATTENYDLVTCNFYVDYNNNSSKSYSNLTTNNLYNINGFINHEIGGYLWIKLIRREFILSNNIRFIKNLNTLEDMLFCIKLCSKQIKIGFIDDFLYHYCRDNENSYIKELKLKNYQEMLRVFNNLFLYLKRNKLLKFTYKAFIKEYISILYGIILIIFKR